MSHLLRPNADTDHDDEHDFYHSYGWHIDTEHHGSLDLQTIEIDWLNQDDATVADLLINEYEYLNECEIDQLISKARSVCEYANELNNLLSDAVEFYNAKDVKNVVRSLRLAKNVEQEHGDAPATDRLAEQLLAEVVHYPLLFVQGEDAYCLIDQCDQDMDALCANLLANYTPDQLPECVYGEPKSLNYRFFHDFQANDKSYRLAYTTGDGGMISLDRIDYGDMDIF